MGKDTLTLCSRASHKDGDTQQINEYHAVHQGVRDRRARKEKQQEKVTFPKPWTPVPAFSFTLSSSMVQDRKDHKRKTSVLEP